MDNPLEHAGAAQRLRARARNSLARGYKLLRTSVRFDYKIQPVGPADTDTASDLAAFQSRMNDEAMAEEAMAEPEPPPPEHLVGVDFFYFPEG